MATLRSPRKTITIASGDIAAGGIWEHDYTADPTSARDTPYNYLILQNYSNQTLAVSYGDTLIYVPALNTWIDDMAYGIRRIQITNTGTSATSGLINVIVSRVVGSDAATVSNVTGANLFDVANGVA